MSIKKLICGIVLSVLAVSSALSADIYKAQPRIAGTVGEGPLQWQGWYIGANLGYGQKDQDLHVSGNDSFSKSVLSSNAFPSTIPLSPKGFLAGVEVGYDHKIADRTYLRILGAYTYSGMEADAYAGGNLVGVQYREKIRNIWDILGGIGWTPGSGRTMLSILGGVTAATIDTTISSTGLICTSSSIGCPNGSSSSQKWGWSIGAEAEHRITQNLSARIRYLYSDLGSQDTTATASYSGYKKTYTTSWNNHQDIEFHRVLFGVNYRF